MSHQPPAVRKRVAFQPSTVDVTIDPQRVVVWRGIGKKPTAPTQGEERAMSARSVTARRFFHTLTGFIFAALATAATATEQCGDQKSKGNPLPCCDNGANCTWWAWRHATLSGWKAIPIGNANKWDDFARANSKTLNISTAPSVGAVGVKNSAPYECGTKKKPKTCDTGHVGVLTGLVSDKKGKVTSITTSQMACGGAYGVTFPKRAVGYYDFYITKK